MKNIIKETLAGILGVIILICMVIFSAITYIFYTALSLAVLYWVFIAVRYIFNLF